MELAKVNVAGIPRGVKITACIIAALAMSACAKRQADQIAASAGTAAAGRQQDFVVNVGVFAPDSSELTLRARQTLDKQALCLNQYNRHAFAIEGHADERGHARVQHRPGCSAHKVAV